MGYVKLIKYTLQTPIKPKNDYAIDVWNGPNLGHLWHTPGASRPHLRGPPPLIPLIPHVNSVNHVNRRRFATKDWYTLYHGRMISSPQWREIRPRVNVVCGPFLWCFGGMSQQNISLIVFSRRDNQHRLRGSFGSDPGWSDQRLFLFTFRWKLLSPR